MLKKKRLRNVCKFLRWNCNENWSITVSVLTLQALQDNVKNQFLLKIYCLNNCKMFKNGFKRKCFKQKLFISMKSTKKYSCVFYEKSIVLQFWTWNSCGARYTKYIFICISVQSFVTLDAITFLAIEIIILRKTYMYNQVV